MENAAFLTEAGVLYDATSEQAQCWRFHQAFGEEKDHELIVLYQTIQRLDVGLMQRAIELLIRRHESLRTCFRVTDGTVKQYVVPYDPALFLPDFFDVSGEVDPRKAILAVTDVYRRGLRKMHLHPLIRSAIFKVSEDSHFVGVLVHHVISDAWSKLIIYKELNHFYRALEQERPAELEPMKMQMKDYARWQKDWLENNGEAARAHWMDKFADLEGSPGVGDPAWASRDANDKLEVLTHGKICSFTFFIRGAVYASLRQLSTNCRTGMPAIVTASFRLLFLWSRNKAKCLIAMPVVNRSVPGTEDLIGYMVGGIYLRSAPDPGQTVTELVMENYIEFLEAINYIICDHHDLSLDEPMLRVNVDVFVNFMKKDLFDTKTLPEGREKEHRQVDGPGYYGLSVAITEYEDGLLFYYTYNPEVYAAESIEAMVEAQEKILQEMCRSTGGTVRQLGHTLSR